MCWLLFFYIIDPFIVYSIKCMKIMSFIDQLINWLMMAAQELKIFFTQWVQVQIHKLSQKWKQMWNITSLEILKWKTFSCAYASICRSALAAAILSSSLTGQPWAIPPARPRSFCESGQSASFISKPNIRAALHARWTPGSKDGQTITSCVTNDCHRKRGLQV